MGNNRNQKLDVISILRYLNYKQLKGGNLDDTDQRVITAAMDRDSTDFAVELGLF